MPPSKSKPKPGDDALDPTLQALMEQNFGPPDGAQPDMDRVQRGLAEVARLSDPAEGAAAAGAADATAAVSDGEGGMQIRWLHEAPPLAPEPPPTQPLPMASSTACFRCGASGATASCARCGVAAYCSKECQRSDWGKGGAFGGHKTLCARYKLLGRDMVVPVADRRAVVAELVARTRLYVCPFAVHHAEHSSSPGFAFVQSECTLAELALPAPRDTHGRPLERPRSLHLMFMALGEYDEYLACMGGAEGGGGGGGGGGGDGGGAAAAAAGVGGGDGDGDGDGGGGGVGGGAGGAVAPGALPSRERIAAEVAARAEDELLLLLRTGDGLSTLLVTPVVPELRVCRALADDYAGKPAIQLDLDDL